ncbi:Glycine cleavage system transcriptional activator [Alphaproteobacteria bacterium SO-S41]|nr:Glycine cleavage system transcriptional activator [Alphaproteobacteria bacterium SO-S41]
MTLPPLNGLRAFEAAARTGSYVAAAEELHVSPSAISRLVKLLEGRLGVALFVRRANGLILTDQGAAYLADLTAAFARIVQATERLRGAGPSALVVGAGPTLAMRWLIPRLPAFNAAYPEIDVRLSTSVAGAEPMRPDWHAAIRLGSGAWPGLSAHFLFTADLFPVCAPKVAARLTALADLAKVAILQAASAPEDWPQWLSAAGIEGAVNLRRAQSFDYPAFALQAALDGLGVAMARAPFVKDDLAAGRLVRPFELAVPNGRGWYFVHRPTAEQDASLAAFRDWVVAAAKD